MNFLLTFSRQTSHRKTWYESVSWYKCGYIVSLIWLASPENTFNVDPLLKSFLVIIANNVVEPVSLLTASVRVLVNIKFRWLSVSTSFHKDHSTTSLLVSLAEFHFQKWQLIKCASHILVRRWLKMFYESLCYTPSFGMPLNTPVC